MKKLLKAILCVLLAVLVIAAGYVAYVFISYHRIGDQALSVEGNGTQEAETGAEYTLMSWNIGFGAYEADYGFFMDGGTQSWAWSKERMTTNLMTIASLLAEAQADFYLLQEVDIGSTRTYHMDERLWFNTELGDEARASVFAQNYDSPFLFYPITQPHGASKSGLMTFSACGIASAERRELPVGDSLMKIVDLDRCYSVCRVPVKGGRELALYNLHLSAYTSDGTVATEQLRLLLEDMRREYEAGNWCVAGGDFNKDLLGDSSAYFTAADQSYNWGQPIPEGMFDGTGLMLVAPLDEENPVPSCRNADGPYHEGQYVLTVDGFIVSENVKVLQSFVYDTGFAYSDHNPVTLEFSLQ